VETAVKKSVLVETQGRIFLVWQSAPNIRFYAKNACPCRFLQKSAPFAEKLFPDSVKMHPIYSKLVEKQWKQP
jgi:hypothetical protein